MNLDALAARDRFLGEIRAWFRAEGFLEVETPVFLDAPSFNAHVEEFSSPWIDGKKTRPLWLRTSPEVFHKRLLAAGATKIYELGKFFRNGERTSLHNPEFTGLEFYETGFDYRRIMERTEQVLSRAITAVAGSSVVRGVDVTPPWDRITVRDAVMQHAGIDLNICRDTASITAAAVAAGIHVASGDSFDDVFFRILLEKKIESKLGAKKPCFLYDYPVQMAAMARRKKDDPGFAERVEVYWSGVELANGFSELTDPAEQRARFSEERDRRDPSLPLDEAFLSALAKMPEATGIAIGLDRVLMLSLGKDAIDDVLAFPFDASR